MFKDIFCSSYLLSILIYVCVDLVDYWFPLLLRHRIKVNQRQTEFEKRKYVLEGNSIYILIFYL